jgi:hypothetical protein
MSNKLQLLQHASGDYGQMGGMTHILFGNGTIMPCVYTDELQYNTNWDTDDLVTLELTNPKFRDGQLFEIDDYTTFANVPECVTEKLDTIKVTYPHTLTQDTYDKLLFDTDWDSRGVVVTLFDPENELVSVEDYEVNNDFNLDTRVIDKLDKLKSVTAMKSDYSRLDFNVDSDGDISTQGNCEYILIGGHTAYPSEYPTTKLNKGVSLFGVVTDSDNQIVSITGWRFLGGNNVSKENAETLNELMKGC